MDHSSSHRWILAPYKKEQETLWSMCLQQDTATYCIDCHRNLGGPYSGISTWLRSLVPNIQKHHPALLKQHALELLSIAPDLQAYVPPPPGTLTSLAVPQERTRFYAGTRTRRIAHGIIQLIIDLLQAEPDQDYEICFLRVDQADVLDQECLAILLRRIPPQQLRITICTSSEYLPENLRQESATYTQPICALPLSTQQALALTHRYHIPSEWQQWFFERAVKWPSEWEKLGQFPALWSDLPPEELTLEQGLERILSQYGHEVQEEIVQLYIESDGTTEYILEKIAYQLFDITARQQKHDERATQLEQQHFRWNEWGAIPYHYERGKNPAQKGAKVLENALNYCFDMGYYDAAIDYGIRGRCIVNQQTQLAMYWNFTTKLITALISLERPEDAESYCKEMRASTDEVIIQLQLAYQTAMLYTRHYKEPRKDHQLAKEWIQIARALAKNGQGVSREEHVFSEVFIMNGLALVEMNLGYPEKALQLITEGIEQMDLAFDSTIHQLHRSVFLHNRGQIYVRTQDYRQALEALTRVIHCDPYYSEYYFDRANVYRQLHRYEEALQDYNSAISYSPPYFEAYYNRAALFSLMGSDEEALADYTYVLELEPHFDLAMINRTSILYEQGDYCEARKALREGLQIHPDHPQLLCTLGLVEMAEKHTEETYHAFTTALQKNPALYEAWTNRAVLEFEQGHLDKAIADLSSALALNDNATILYNRGFAYQSQQQWKKAIADYTQALNMENADTQELLSQRALCYIQDGNAELARQDVVAHSTIEKSSYMSTKKRSF